jgi:hypothetical protein
VNRVDATGLWGFAIGFGGEAGISFLTGLWGAGGGVYVDVTGGSFGLYGSGNFSLGAGAAFGASPQVSGFTSLSDFQGWGVGGELDTLLASGVVTTPLSTPGSGAVVTICAFGPGGAIFAGGTLTYTAIKELFSWKHKSSALAPASPPSKPCPPTSH